MVQAQRTSSNLLEPHHRRDSKVCRVLSHECGVVRLYRTFSNFIFTGEARCAGCLGTRSGWFKCIEPPQTFSNHIIAVIARQRRALLVHALCIHCSLLDNWNKWLGRYSSHCDPLVRERARATYAATMVLPTWILCM